MNEDNIIFQIEVIARDGDIAYAESIGGAMMAYHQLHRERKTMGTRVRITNVVTGKVVWEDQT